MKADTTIRFVGITEKKQWNALAMHPLQSWEWGEFRAAMGIDVVRIGVYETNRLIEVWQLTFHTIPHTSFTVGYFPKGPPTTILMLNELKKIGKQKNAIYIQIEPNVVVSKNNTNENLLSSCSYVVPSHRSMFTKHTFSIDCTQSEEDLLKAMHSKTRYNINLAKKRGVFVCEDNSQSAYMAYERLSDETTARQGFFAHNHTYHRTLWKLLKNTGITRIFTASYEGEILAAWMIFVWNDTIYYPYGASSREHREVMAPTLLLWEIVRWAKKQGYTSFDLWGALGDNPDPKDPWYGFHKFKQGYNPSHITFIGSFDIIIKPLAYQLFKIADSIRWTLLKFKHRG